MSDTPHATDWWLASDGRWYPPTSVPSPPPPPLPPPPPTPPDYGAPPYGVPPQPLPGAYGQYQPSPTSAPMPVHPSSVPPALSAWLQTLLWLAGALAAVGSALGLASLLLFNALFDMSFSSSPISDFERYDSVDNAFRFFLGTGVLVGLPIFVLTVIWAFKANRAADRLRPGPRRWGAGWAIGSWFIPVANAILPKLVLDETERIATASRTGQQVGPDWRRTSTSVIGWLWWITLVGSFLAIDIGIQFDQSHEFPASRGMENAYYAIVTLGLIAQAAAAVLGVFYVSRVSPALSPAALTGAP